MKMTNKIIQPNCKDQWISYKTCQKFPSCIKPREFNFYIYFFFMAQTWNIISRKRTLLQSFFMIINMIYSFWHRIRNKVSSWTWTFLLCYKDSDPHMGMKHTWCFSSRRLLQTLGYNNPTHGSPLALWRGPLKIGLPMYSKALQLFLHSSKVLVPCREPQMASCLSRRESSHR